MWSLHESYINSYTQGLCHMLWSQNLNSLIGFLKNPVVIFQTPKHVQNIFNFNTTSYPHGYLVLFVPKTPSVVWYFIMDLIPPKVCSYFTLFESKSVVIFIFVCCLIISLKLHKFTWTLHRVFPFSNLSSYVVFY